MTAFPFYDPRFSRFASALPDEACRHIRELEIVAAYEVAALLSSDALALMFQRMPGLTTLTLWGGVARRDAPSVPLSSLRHLQHLTLEDWEALPCIPPDLAAQLKTLSVGGVDGFWHRVRCPGFPSPAQITSLVSSMTSLERLTLEGGIALSPSELRGVLDALAPSVRHCTVRYVCDDVSCPNAVTASCHLQCGHLTGFHLERLDHEPPIAADRLGRLMEAALLPCRALGPRLPYLRVGVAVDLREDLDPDLDPQPDLDLDREPDLGPAVMELIARCDSVALEEVVVTSASAPGRVLAVATALGMPTVLSFTDGAVDVHGRVRLPAGPPGCARAADGRSSDSSSSASSSKGGSFRPQASAPAQAGPWVLERILERMSCAPAVAPTTPAHAAVPADDPTQGAPRPARPAIPQALLRGPAAAWLARPTSAAQAWVTQLNRCIAHLRWRVRARTRAAIVSRRVFHRMHGTGRSRPGLPRVYAFRRLPYAGAFLLDFFSQATAMAAVRAVRRTAQKYGGGGTCGAAGSSTLPAVMMEAFPARLHVNDAIEQGGLGSTRGCSFGGGVCSQKVLEGLWDGTEEGAPGADVTGLEQLAWMLEAWAGVVGGMSPREP
ncbi:hypothetical protein HYH03_010142 [Edaphochlamys debaryana]|uniref:Uncharacterized protein n=1 Tax=Edaphochlamys debaryana TaxID=47281 RepID=A0A836BXU3_9CHLO|nr:hypothetical protein HYH03_010142 [Edaphochlamys debaryana]|eukprot:KAG2491574.1 hypothetical protein HYH03_010142 [Edaphochlamys debaryana]